MRERLFSCLLVKSVADSLLVKEVVLYFGLGEWFFKKKVIKLV